MASAPELKKSVLVIEDHAESCHVLKLMLRRRGLHAECAESLSEALRCLEVAERQNRPFSCLVSDLALPDSNALETVESLRRLKERSSIPVRAISGVQDPHVIEACRVARIPLILKGTSAEGIMESVLYAIAESDPDPEIDEMIADNRAHHREIPQGFFHGWSSVTKFFTIAGIIIGTFLSAIALGGWLYHSLEDSILKRKDADSHFVQLDEKMKRMDGQISDNSERIRKREDDNIKIFAKLDELKEKIESNRNDYTAQLNRIEAKVDRK